MKQKDRITQYSLIIWAFFLIAFFSASAQAATHYVSATGSASWANSTNISTPCSLITANTNADDGDIVYLRGGTYSVKDNHAILEPDHSGSDAGTKITFIAYQNETPIIDGTNVDAGYATAYLAYKSYITIDGLTFSNPTERWHVISGGIGSSMRYGVIIQNCTFNTRGVYSKSLDGLQVLNNTFAGIIGAGVNISGDDDYKSTNTKISGNTLTGTFGVGNRNADAILLHSAYVGAPIHGVGNYHLIENNSITMSAGDGGENCIDIESGKYVVVRNNTCTGPGVRRPGFIVGGVTDDAIGGSNYVEYVRFIGNTSYNLRGSVEHFNLVGEDRDNIQFIRNIAYGTGEHNLALANTLYGSPSNDGVRVAHNVFDAREIRDGDVGGILVVSKAHEGNDHGAVTDVRMKNNIIILESGDRAMYWAEPGDSDMFSDSNLYWNYTKKGDAVLWGYPRTHTLAKIKSSFLWELNGIEADPLFSDLSGRDYSLKAKEHEYSPAIDAGGWLTSITSATGSGKSFKADDPLWFYDGWNIIGEKGDKIKTENGQSATITLINYDTGEITVDKSISWTKGEGIGLDYKGTRPDIGAKEYSSNISPKPKPILAISPPKGFKFNSQ